MARHYIQEDLNPNTHPFVPFIVLSVYVLADFVLVSGG
jgi:hypothetical protein